jgi:Fic-DOC domain mobile mystery protein B
MGLDFKLIEGQTPLDEEESEGLLIPSITTRGELDEFEQLNIESAIKWSLGKTFTPEEILTEAFVKRIHQKMYGDVWKWAGKFRKSDKNIGVQWARIGVGLKTLLDDCKYWIANKTSSADEIAVRFKHRVVQIHCFSNGNGRHSRFMGDLIVTNVFNAEPFSWGGNKLVNNGNERVEYLKAIKAGDQGNITPLVEFSRK